MLENFIFSANVVIPVFIMIFIGWVLRRTNAISESFVNESNKLMFYFGLPVMLFSQISKADFSTVFDLNLVVFALSVTFVVFVILIIFAKNFIKDCSLHGSFIQGGFRGNFALIGLPLSINIFGQEAVARSSVLLAIIVLTYNVLAVIILEHCSVKRIKHDTVFLKVKSLLIFLLKNPLFMSIIIALPFSLLKIQFPVIISKPMDYIGYLAIPLSLIGIGGTFKFENAKATISLSILAAAIKTAITPLIFVPLAIFLGFRGLNLGIIAVLLTAPTAVNSFIMAKETGNDQHLAGSIIVMSSGMSLFTAFVSVYILKVLNFI